MKHTTSWSLYILHTFIWLQCNIHNQEELREFKINMSTIAKQNIDNTWGGYGPENSWDSIIITKVEVLKQ